MNRSQLDTLNDILTGAMDRVLDMQYNDDSEKTSEELLSEIEARLLTAIRIVNGTRPTGLDGLREGVYWRVRRIANRRYWIIRFIRKYVSYRVADDLDDIPF